MSTGSRAVSKSRDAEVANNVMLSLSKHDSGISAMNHASTGSA